MHPGLIHLKDRTVDAQLGRWRLWLLRLDAVGAQRLDYTHVCDVPVLLDYKLLLWTLEAFLRLRAIL